MRAGVYPKTGCSARRHYLGDPVGPTRKELSREARLECLHRLACFEPRHAAGDWHSQYRRLRSLVCDLDGANRFDGRADLSMKALSPLDFTPEVESQRCGRELA